MAETTILLESVEETVKAMLTENTGRHLLDSGMEDGRHWQQNQQTPPWEQPRIDVNSDYVTKNVYHFLTGEAELYRTGVTVTHPAILENGEIEPCLADRSTVLELEQSFYDWAESGERERWAWLTCMQEFAELMCGPDAVEDHYYGYSTFNTYNHDSSISQVLQGVTFVAEDEWYVLLQIHGGCDVRGGYTKPRLFEIFEPGYIMPMELEFDCPDCMITIYESALYRREPEDCPEFDAEGNRVLCPDCGGEMSVW